MEASCFCFYILKKSAHLIYTHASLKNYTFTIGSKGVKRQLNEKNSITISDQFKSFASEINLTENESMDKIQSNDITD